MILVTGVTGMLGKFCISELLKRNYNIRVLVRSNSEHKLRNLKDKVQMYIGSLEDKKSLVFATKDV